MTLEFKLTENDILQHQLYMASRSARLKKTWRKGKLQPLIFFAVAGLGFVYLNDVPFAIVLFCLVPIWYFFWPVLTKSSYYTNLKNAVIDIYHAKVGVANTMQLLEDRILENDTFRESTYKVTTVKEIIELPAVILIQLSSNEAIVIPQNQLQNKEATITHLKYLSKLWNVNYITEPGWKW
jgi:hypothetical protein